MHAPEFELEYTYWPRTNRDITSQIARYRKTATVASPNWAQCSKRISKPATAGGGTSQALLVANLQRGYIVKTIASIVIVLMLAGCATSGANYRPVVDLHNRDPGRYQTDLSECQAYATQRMDAASGAVAGAVAGALLGAFLTPRGSRNYVAGRGAVLGGLAGAGGANETQETIVKRCLAGRGYSVLN